MWPTRRTMKRLNAHSPQKPPCSRNWACACTCAGWTYRSCDFRPRVGGRKLRNDWLSCADFRLSRLERNLKGSIIDTSALLRVYRVLDDRRGAGHAEKESLHLVSSHLHESSELRLVLDALGDHAQTHFFSQFDHRSNHGSHLWIRAQIANERAVDLKGRERQSRQVSQA